MGCAVSVALSTSLTLPRFLPAAAAKMVHHAGYWTAGSFGWPWLERVLDFSTGFLLGFAFLLVSPDTWKRVYIVSHPASRRGVWLLFMAAAFPFIAIRSEERRVGEEGRTPGSA